MADQIPDSEEAQDVAAMRLALCEAAQAAMLGEVPVGAVVILNGSVLGAGGNRRESAQDPTAHAEILALRQAAKALGSWRVCDATLYVTQEPCPMCAGALWATRIGGVVIGTESIDAGALGSLYHLGQDPRLNHEFPVRVGVERGACAAILQDFFAARR